MEDYTAYSTKTTPSVLFEAATGNLWLEGKSYPENAAKFYEPLCAWLKQAFAEGLDAVTFNCKLEYCNSSSAKWIYEIFQMLEKHSMDGHKVVVNWYYFNGDEDILENGKEFAEDMNLPFNYIAY